MASKNLSVDEIQYIVSAKTQEAQKEIYELTKAGKALRKEESLRKQEMISLEAQGKKTSKRYRNLEAECKNYSTQIRDNNKKIEEATRKLDVNAMSMSQLQQRAKQLRRELNQIPKALNPQLYDSYEKQLQKVNGRMVLLKANSESITTLLADKSTLTTMFGMTYLKVAEVIGTKLKQIKDRMVQLVDESVELAEASDGVYHKFKELDDGTLLQRLRTATKNTVNDLDLMRAVVQANDFRIPLQDLAKYLQFAQIKAQQTGQSVDYMTDSIVKGLGRKSILILDNLAISASEINEETKKTGDFMSAVASIVDKQLAAAGENYVSAADKATQASVRLQNAQLKLGKELLPLKENYDEVSSSMKILFLDSVSWIVKHRDVIFPLVTAVGAYTLAYIALNTRIKENIVLEKASILLSKSKTVVLGLLKPAILLSSAAYNKLTGNVTRASAAMKLFKTTSKAGWIGLVAGAVIGLGTAWYKSWKRMKEATDETLIMSKISKEASRNIQNESDDLRALYKTLKDSSLGYKQRKSALDKIQSIVPEYHASLSKEGKLINDNSEAIENYVKKLKVAEMMKITSSKLAEVKNKKKAYEEDNEEGIMRYLSVKMSAGEYENIDQAAAAKGMSMTAYKAIEKQINALNDEEKRYEGILDYYSKEMAKIDTLGVTNEIEKPDDDNSDPRKVALANMKSAHQDELNQIRLQGREKLEAEDETNRQLLQSDLNYYNQRLQELYKFKESSKKASEKADYEKQIVETRTKLLDTEDKLDRQRLEKVKKWKDKELQEIQNAQTQQEQSLNEALANQEITQQQHDTMTLSLNKLCAEQRLEVLQQYHKGVQNLELNNGVIQADAVREAGQEVVKADAEVAQSRADITAKIGSMVKDFKSEFKVTTVEEDYQAQLQVLEAAYQARKELAQKEHADTLELDKAYESAKSQLDMEHEEKAYSIRQQYGLTTQQEEYNMELERLKAARDQGLIVEEEYEKAVQNLKRDSYKKQFDYYSGLFSGAVQALQQAEMDQVDAKYDAEIEAAQGNEEEVERLENEKAQKKLDIQKKYADVNFAIKASQIIADTSVAVMKALADLGPIAGPVSAALMSITGLAQLASAKAERDKVKNMTLSGSSSSSAAGKRVATGLEEGGSIDVVRRQDNKLYPDASYNPDARGFIDRPTVIVGDGPAGRSREWVASNGAVSNPTIAPVLDMIDRAQRAGNIRTFDLNKRIQSNLSGFASGGSIAGNSFSPSDTGGGSTKVMSELTDTLRYLRKNGFPTYLGLTQIDAQQKLRNRSRKIGSK